MRITSALTSAAAFAGAALLFAGCSGGASSPGTSSAVPSTGAQSQARASQVSNGTGVAPAFLPSLRLGAASATVVTAPGTSSGVQELGISDFGTSSVEILNRTYALMSSITGLSGPDGNWIDHGNNLYVANYAGPNVQEYPSESTTPSFTYSAGLADPVNVTTDTNGNVFVADYAFGGNGFIAEYAPGVNNIVQQCSPGGAAEGVVVDAYNNVFVSYQVSGTGGFIVEYKHGLAGCKGTVLGVTLGFAGGLQMDNQRNLVAADQSAGVDIIPPPYTSIASTISGAVDTFHIALNLNNTKIFIADPGNGDVLVDDYPSGTNVTTLGTSNGLTDPSGVATWHYAK